MANIKSKIPGEHAATVGTAAVNVVLITQLLCCSLARLCIELPRMPAAGTTEHKITHGTVRS